MGKSLDKDKGNTMVKNMIKCPMCGSKAIFSDYEGNQYCTRCN